jgi:hypothetical protein
MLSVSMLTVNYVVKKALYAFCVLSFAKINTLWKGTLSVCVYVDM